MNAIGLTMALTTPSSTAAISSVVVSLMCTPGTHWVASHSPAAVITARNKNPIMEALPLRIVFRRTP